MLAIRLRAGRADCTQEPSIDAMAIRVTVHGDCPDFRGEARENGTVPLRPKGTGTFFGPGTDRRLVGPKNEPVPGL